MTARPPDREPGSADAARIAYTARILRKYWLMWAAEQRQEQAETGPDAPPERSAD